MAWWRRSKDVSGRDGRPEPDRGNDEEALRLSASSESFEDWFEAMHPALTGFLDLTVPPVVAADFSRESLARFERFLLDRFGSGDEVLAPDADRKFVDGAVRYVGETFTRHSGGGWHYDTHPDAVVRGRPHILVDSQSPVPVSPFHLIVKSMNRRTGEFLTEIFDNQHRNALEWAQCQGRPPVKVPSPGLDWVPQDTPALRDFLATLEAYLTTWATEVVPPAARWDRSRESLEALGALLLDRLPDAEHLKDPAHQPLLEGAIRYIGQTLLSVGGGEWVHNPGDKDAKNPFVGTFYVRKGSGDSSLTKVPEVTAGSVVRRRTAASLTTAFDQWTDS